MKKIIHILLSAIILFATSGFTLSKHYCHGHLVDIAINVEAESCCGFESDCCHNENEYLKLKEDFSISELTDIDQDYSFEITLFLNAFFELNSSEISHSIYQDKGYIPPPSLTTILANLQSFRL